MEADKQDGSASAQEAAFGFVFTADLPQLFCTLGISLLVTTYQAQRVLAVSAKGPKLSMLMRVFDRPTGIALEHNSLALVSALQVWLFEGQCGDAGLPEQAPGDLCFVPRSSFVTGDVSGHEIAWVEEELILVNTRFSCLCTLSPHFSFLPVWQPPFISAIKAEDRCHLNGLATDSSGVRFVTALGSSDTEQGWRENKRCGGVLLEVPSGEVVARGLSMPHSPRLAHGKLWLLESGRGELQTVDLATGVREIVCRFPGYLRGLAFFGSYAFVGLCQIRETNMFGGMPVQQLFPELKCGIAVVDIRTGRSAGFIEFTKGIEELFEIKVVAGALDPQLIGFEDPTVNHLYSFDPAGLAAV